MKKIDPKCEENETLEKFFGNAERAEIVYVPKTAGSADIMIGNATDEHLVAKLDYEILNKQTKKDEQTVGVEPSVDVTKTTVAAKINGKRTQEYANLEQKPKVDKVVLQAHSSGKKMQIALDKGYDQGSRAVGITIYRKEDSDIEKSKPVTYFKVEQGEMWILYPGPEGEVLEGKAMAKRSLFSKREDIWMDKDKIDRDPHACLKKGDDCEVCFDPALKNGSRIKKHRKIRAGEKCRVCKKYTQPERSEQPQQPQQSEHPEQLQQPQDQGQGIVSLIAAIGAAIGASIFYIFW